AGEPRCAGRPRRVRGGPALAADVPADRGPRRVLGRRGQHGVGNRCAVGPAGCRFGRVLPLPPVSTSGDAPDGPEQSKDQHVRPSGPGPIGGSLSELVYGLAERASVPSLTRRHDSTAVLGLFAFVNGVISI